MEISFISPQVLRLLDVIGLPELVIQLATSAITEAGDDWKSQVRTSYNLVIFLEVCHGCDILISVVLLPHIFDTLGYFKDMHFQTSFGFGSQQ